MAKKKDSKALFEVLSKTETTMSVPDWMKARPADSAAPLPVDDSVLPPVPVGEPAPAESEQEEVSQDVEPVEAERPREKVAKVKPAVAKVEKVKAEETKAEKTKADMTKEILARAKKAREEKAKAAAVAKAEAAALVKKTKAKGKKKLDEEAETPEEETTEDEELQDESPEDALEDDGEIEDVEDDEDVDDEDVEDVAEEDLDESDDEAEIAPRKRPILRQPKWFRKQRRERPAVETPDETATAERFALNPKMIAILIVAAGVLLLLAFGLGRLTSGRSGTTPENQAGPPVEGKEIRSVVGSDAPETSQSGRRNPDRFFLIIETLRGNGDADKAEADRIIKFCQAQGMPADMVEMQMGDKNRVAVWSLQGFRFQTSEEALEFARKVEETGLAYFKKYKTYKFQQRRRRDGSLRPFFLSGKIETGG